MMEEKQTDIQLLNVLTATSSRLQEVFFTQKEAKGSFQFANLTLNKPWGL